MDDLDDLIRHTIFAVAPATFNKRDALRYTGVSEKQFAEFEKNGWIRGLPKGRRRAIIYSREQLDKAVGLLFGDLREHRVIEF